MRQPVRLYESELKLGALLRMSENNRAVHNSVLTFLMCILLRSPRVCLADTQKHVYVCMRSV